jgi:hypothetical protein
VPCAKPAISSPIHVLYADPNRFAATAFSCAGTSKTRPSDSFFRLFSKSWKNPSFDHFPLHVIAIAAARQPEAVADAFPEQA